MTEPTQSIELMPHNEDVIPTKTFLIAAVRTAKAAGLTAEELKALYAPRKP